MAIATPRFHHIAQSIIERTSGILNANVAVTDSDGIIVASSGTFLRGQHIESMVKNDDEAHVLFRIPLQFDSHSGEIIVTDMLNQETIPAHLTHALIDLIINQAAVVDQIPNQHELKDSFIHNLLRGPLDDEGDLVREGQILGMDLSRPRAVILINAADFILAEGGKEAEDVFALSDAQIRRRAQLVIASVVGFFDLPNDTICGYIGNGEVVILKASRTTDLSNWADQNENGMPDTLIPSWTNLVALKRATTALLGRLQRDTRSTISIGIGRYHPGVQGVARSYQDARAALSLGRHFRGENQSYCLDELGLVALIGLSDEQTKRDLASYLLGPLDHEPTLIETLEAFFDLDCCPSTTAKRLSIHRNTLSYRLNKVHSLTGLNPYCFDDAVQIRLSLALQSLEQGIA